MLTDIFANRYIGRRLFEEFNDAERRLIVQTFRLATEQLNETSPSIFWADLHNRLTMELGLERLAAPVRKYQGGKYVNDFEAMCKNWALIPFESKYDPDPFIKKRLSLVELAFRKKYEQVLVANAVESSRRAQNEALLQALGQGQATPSGLRAPLLTADSAAENNRKLNRDFDATVAELNERFRQAGVGLHYHNGFLQIADDKLTVGQIEEPFWSIVADEKWKNVDLDMKEAVDARDTDGRDPAWFAARALESTIKIISKARGLTTGNERGGHNYIDNLRRGDLITIWESDQLKSFFTNVRNPFGHGPGDQPMPELSPEQTDWAIEYCMSWIKKLVRSQGSD